jgi:hypothetical protein
MSEKLTNLHEIMIRRINRKLQITRKGNRLQAVLHLPVTRKKTGELETESFDRFLTIETTPAGFSATLYTKSFWKRTYWRRWRESKADLVHLESARFLHLAAAIRNHFE